MLLNEGLENIIGSNGMVIDFGGTTIVLEGMTMDFNGSQPLVK